MLNEEIKKFEELTGHSANDYSMDFLGGFWFGYDTARPQGEWILVSERMPKENICEDGYHEPSKHVLVQARNGSMHITRYWTRDKKNVWTDLRYPEDIIAWQELPQPYKKGGQADEL